MLAEMIDRRPMLTNLAKAPSVRHYLEPAFHWNPKRFPYREVLNVILCDEIKRLHKLNDKEVVQIEKQCANTWSVQTGDHICIPRVRERPTPRKAPNGMELPSHNPMVYQGVVYWAAMNKFFGYDFSIALSTGRIPLNNPLAASYLEISEDKDLIRLMPEAWHQVPQILIPAISKNAIEIIRGKIGIDKHALPLRVKDIFQKVMSCIELNNESFIEQIASAQSLMMSETMPIRHVSIESENIAVKFLTNLLSDHSSLTSRIFSDKNLRKNFLSRFNEIGTGWTENGSPFYEAVFSEKFPKLVEYSGSLEPKDVLQKLHQGIIFPKGVMKFFLFMVEGGLLPIGGMAQNVYCSEIKRRAVLFLDSLGERDRIDELVNMPTEIATITPCWSMNNNKNGGMTNILNCLEAPLNSNDLLQMLNISGAESIKNASPVLYPFLIGKPFLAASLNG